MHKSRLIIVVFKAAEIHIGDGIRLHLSRRGEHRSPDTSNMRKTSHPTTHIPIQTILHFALCILHCAAGAPAYNGAPSRRALQAFLLTHQPLNSHNPNNSAFCTLHSAFILHFAFCILHCAAGALIPHSTPESLPCIIEKKTAFFHTPNTYQWYY